MEALLGLLIAFCVLVIVPLLLLKVFIGLLWGLIALPFKVLGALLHLAFGLLGGLARAFAWMVGLLGLLFGFLVLVIALPLLPLLAVAGVVWLLAKAFRPSYRPA